MSNMRDRRASARLKREQQAQELSRKRWHPPRPVAWCFIIASTLLLFGLGFWQLERLAWKEGLLADIYVHQLQRPYEGIPENTELLKKEMSFARIKVTGEFLHEHELHLAARYYNSQLGYHILTPFRLEDGRVILLNRGWVHVDFKDAATRLEGQLQGMQHIVIMVRNDNDRNYFTPEHDVARNIWFWRDIAKASEVTELELIPVNFDVLYATPPGNMPIASDGLVRLRNDHLGYAITWFMVGISGIIIFILYHFRSDEEMQKMESRKASKRQGMAV